MTHNSNSRPGYKWVLLILSVLSIAVVSYTQFQITASTMVPVIFEMFVIEAQHLSELTTAAMLAGMIFALPGGVIADKIGTKITCVAAMMLSLTGSIIRIFAKSYNIYFMAMFLLGFGASFISMCSAKMFSTCFDDDQLPFAMGCMMAAGAFGGFISNATTNTFFDGDLRLASIVGTIAIALMLILWMLLIKEEEHDPKAFASSMFEPLKKALRNGNIWLVSVCAALAMGFQMTLNVNYQSALSIAKGVDDIMCSVYASLFTVCGTLGSIMVPGICSRLGRNRVWIPVFSLAGGMLIYIGWIYLKGMAMAVLISTGAFFAFGGIPVLMGYPALLKGIGPENAGSASGLITTVQMAGAFFIPSFVIAPMASREYGTDYSTLILYGCICVALSGVLAAFLPEIKSKTK